LQPGRVIVKTKMANPSKKIRTNIATSKERITILLLLYAYCGGPDGGKERNPLAWPAIPALPAAQSTAPPREQGFDKSACAIMQQAADFND
jgi:hypothetical protein